MRRLPPLLLWLALGAWTRTEPFDPFHQAAVAPRPGARAPMSGAFRDQAGLATTLSVLAHGRPIVLAPVQYLCPSLCGLTLTGLDQAAARQADRDFTLVALDIDPREGPADAAKAVKALASPVAALTGPGAKAVTDALGYRYAWDGRLKQYAHISAVAVLRPDGRLVRWLAGPQVDGRELEAALREAQGGPPMPVSQRILILCYHLLSPGGAYDHRVIAGLRVMGATVLTALLLLIGWLVGRERLRGRL